MPWFFSNMAFHLSKCAYIWEENCWPPYWISRDFADHVVITRLLRRVLPHNTVWCCCATFQANRRVWVVQSQNRANVSQTFAGWTCRWFVFRERSLIISGGGAEEFGKSAAQKCDPPLHIRAPENDPPSILVHRNMTPPRASSDLMVFFLLCSSHT